MEFDFNEDQKMLRDTARKFLEAECAPDKVRAILDDDSKTYDEGLYTKLVEMGFTGAAIPEEFGGLGLGYLEHVIAVEEVSRASASLGLSYGAHSNLCVNQIRRICLRDFFCLRSRPQTITRTDTQLTGCK